MKKDTQPQHEMRRATDVGKPAPRRTSAAAGGVPMRTLNYLLVVLAVVISVLLLFATWQAINGYTLMRDATDQYIAWQQDAADMQAGSDYLTAQVRRFVVTGDQEYVQNYFYEVNVSRRRDKALQDLKENLAGTDFTRAMETAMKASTTLMEREYYAMRLVIDAKGYNLTDFPAVIQQTELSSADQALTAEEKSHQALTMLFDEEYQDYKTIITTDVDHCLQQLMKERQDQQVSAWDRLLPLLRQQPFLIAGLLVIVLVIVVLTMKLVIRPLQRSADLVREQRPLPLKGAAEFRFLANTYNIIVEENRKRKEQLSYDATHDVLTGLYNRSAYERIFKGVEREDSIALLLIDVDKFKGINDTYGHETGDKILSKVAATLTSSFRSDDFVCRIGGDEFAIIMTNMSSELKELVRSKVQGANDKLQTPKDGLPPISLSVGVAFGDRKKSTGNIFKDADAALYEVKRNGRSGCAFYE